jgi:hypothetical protein
MSERRSGSSAAISALMALGLCLGGGSLASGAGVDELELRLLEAAELPLRWDNLEGPPLLVSGPRPKHVRKAGAHLLRLDPGSAVTVRLEPGVMLRIRNPFGPLEAGALRASLSDGSGLWPEAALRRVESGDSLLLQPGADHTLLARLTRPAAHGTGIEVALFTSRREPIGPLARYRQLAAPAGTRLEVRSEGASGGTAFWRLEPGRPAAITLSGPRRLAVETRVLYPSTESRAFQAYRVRARLDGAPLAILDYETTLDRAPVSVDGRGRAASGLEAAYLDVPAGRHRLELDSSADLAARVLARDASEYLLPDLNQDPPAVEAAVEARPAAEVPPELTEDEAARIASLGPRGAARIHRLALRLARESSRPDGGLVAASLLSATAASRSDAPWLRDVAESFQAFHTYYRDLLPSAKQDKGAQRVGWFVTRRLRRLGEEPRALAVSEALLDSPPEGLARGIFLVVPEGRSNAQRYPLPCRRAPSWLRVVAESASGSGAEFFLQVGEEPPIRFKVGPGPDRAPEEYRPSRADAALAALGRRGRVLPGGAPLSVGTAELALPVAAREILLWREASGPASRVALQHRASRPYRLSESEYRDAVRRAGGEAAVRSAFLTQLAGRSPARADTSATAELRNHWDRLSRLLAARERVFASAVVPSAVAARRPSAAEDVAKLAAEAGALAARNEWLPALEAWGGVYFSAAGAARREAALARVAALEALGETYLAEVQLRGLFLHDADPQAREDAYARLEALYARAGDADGRARLLAAAARRTPTPERLAALADALLSEGEPELALMLGLALGLAETRPATLARAALGARWWGAFEDALARLTPEEQGYWRGERLLAQGDASGAVASFERGGGAGRAAARHLEDAIAIRKRLSSRDAPERAEAVFEWERWLVRDPRPRTWQETEAFTVDHAGWSFTAVDECGPELRHVRATPDRPLRLELLGPRRLRIEARPVRPAGSTRAVDDWLKVAVDDRLELVPINANRPSVDLRLAGSEGERPGERVDAILDVGPGLHHVVVSAAQLPLLLRVHAEVAENPVGLLPDLLPATLAAVVEGPQVAAGAGLAWGRASILPLDGGEPVLEAIPAPASGSGHATVVPMSGLAPLVEARLALRLGTPLASESEQRLADGFVADEAVTPQERLLALGRLGDPRATCRGLLTNDLGAPQPLRQSRCVAEGEIDAALALPADGTDADVVRRLALLLELAEQRPEHTARAQALADALFSGRAHLDQARTTHDRLMRGSAWLPAPSPATSAGVRSIELPAGSPEDPRLRVRRALLPPALPGEQILSGDGTLALSFSNSGAAQVELTLEREDLEYLPPTPLTAWRQLDEGPVEGLDLTPEAPRQVLRTSIPPGRHVLRIGIGAPLVDQFLRVRARERRIDAWAPLVDRLARSYHVGTPEEPFRIELEGPAWVRVDERRGERTFVRYEAVPDAGRNLEIRPDAGREVLLRLFQRAPAAAAGPGLLLRPQREDPEPGAQPLLELPDAVRPVRLRLEDVLRLGRQEDPTWSLSSALEGRVLFDEDASGRQPAQRFLEARLARRFSHAGGRRYDRTDLLARLNEQGGPTVGLLQQFRRRAGGSLVLKAEASAYLQTGTGSAAPEDGARWSLAVAGEVSNRSWLGPKTSHTPSLALFGRALSLAADATLDPAVVDRDVFTRYKARHRAGLVVSDTLTHAPWLDAEAWGTAMLVSNEAARDGLDHLSLETGWRQKLGALLLAAEYRATRFFADQDRLRGLTRHALSVQLGAETWHRNRQRLELDLRYRYLFRDRRSSVGVFLSWYPDHGRGFRDFAPRSLTFRELRERRAARTANNRLWEEP